jgi:23S rRNA pseudouridine2605 synthase
MKETMILASDIDESSKMRLNRFLARAGVASRRKSDALIQDGVVQINGQTVDQPGHSVVVDRDRVVVNGQPVELPTGFEYLLLYKTRGSLVTRTDTHGRATIYEGVSKLRPSTVAVGRLDLDTSGVLLLMDDGELAFRLMHPRYQVDKLYEVVVDGRPAPQSIAALRRGVELEDGLTAPAKVGVKGMDRHGHRTHLQMCLREGRKRQVKRMCAAVGHPVRQLKRVCFAGLGLDGLQPGQWRRLDSLEVRDLQVLTGLAP